MFTFTCPNCSAEYDLEPDRAGQKFKCTCGARVEIPGLSQAKPPMVECYECGELVSIEDTRRVEMETGAMRSNFWLGYGLIRFAKTERVRVCNRCLRRDARESGRDRTDYTSMIVIGIGIFVVVMALFCGAIMIAAISGSPR